MGSPVSNKHIFRTIHAFSLRHLAAALFLGAHWSSPGAPASPPHLPPTGVHPFVLKASASVRCLVLALIEVCGRIPARVPSEHLSFSPSSSFASRSAFAEYLCFRKPRTLRSRRRFLLGAPPLGREREREQWREVRPPQPPSPGLGIFPPSHRVNFDVLRSEARQCAVLSMNVGV